MHIFPNYETLLFHQTLAFYGMWKYAFIHSLTQEPGNEFLGGGSLLLTAEDTEGTDPLWFWGAPDSVLTRRLRPCTVDSSTRKEVHRVCVPIPLPSLSPECLAWSWVVCVASPLPSPLGNPPANSTFPLSPQPGPEPLLLTQMLPVHAPVHLPSSLHWPVSTLTMSKTCNFILKFLTCLTYFKSHSCTVDP